MGTVTYPDLSVAASVNEFFIPVQLNVKEHQDTVKSFQVAWTPNIHIIDTSRKSIYHVEGWLPPSDFAAMLMAAHGQYFLKNERYSEAQSIFQKAWEKYPQSEFAAEALYYLGVSSYLESHEAKGLLKSWDLLHRYHPKSLWAVRSAIL